MFRGFSKKQSFNGFPSPEGFGMQKFSEEYGFSKCGLWLLANSNMDASSDSSPISYWTDKVNQYTFSQFTPALQPRLKLSDPDFNGLPVYESHVAGKMLQSLSAVPILPDYTQAYVYQSLTLGNGTSWNARMISSGDHTNSRAAGEYFGFGRNNNGQLSLEVGYYAGGSGLQKTTASISNTNPHIVVINRNHFIGDGFVVDLGAGNANPYRGFLFNTIGGPTAGFCGIFKVAEILNYHTLLTELECLELCNNLNLKYAIY